jgi:tetratricopeptide (TPR) repeat protein
LARIYVANNYWDEFFSEDFMDSALLLVNRSLYYDHQLAESFLIRGVILMEKDLQKSAAQDLQVAIRLNPNSWENYFQAGMLYPANDLPGEIRNLWKAASLNYGPEKPRILKELAIRFGMAGFRKQSIEFINQALDLDGDSVIYYTLLAAVENWSGRYEQAVGYCLEALKLDPFDTRALDRIAYNLMFLGDFDRSYRYYKEMEKSQTAFEEMDINDRHRIGYVYWKEGLKDEANELFDLQEQYSKDMIQLGRGLAVSGFAHYDLAGVYAFRGEKELAMENLRMFNRREINGIWMVTLINDDPLFDGIRDEPEFRQIVQDVELKYQALHEKIERWLQENGLQ